MNLTVTDVVCKYYFLIVILHTMTAITTNDMLTCT